jgi:hypothetical protein
MATTTTNQLREDIWRAIEAGEPLTDEQFRELIRHEAQSIGLTFGEAVERARNDTLPKNAVGLHLELLISMLDAEPA